MNQTPTDPASPEEPRGCHFSQRRVASLRVVEAKEPGKLAAVYGDKDLGFLDSFGKRLPRMKPEFRPVVVSNRLDAVNIAKPRSANAMPAYTGSASGRLCLPSRVSLTCNGHTSPTSGMMGSRCRCQCLRCVTPLLKAHPRGRWSGNDPRNLGWRMRIR
jgi:hypothetical protein